MSVSFTARTRLLFIGDSITDCDRASDPEHLGSGYVRLIRDYLVAKLPRLAPQVINMGIGGNKITDLAERWMRDVIEQRPDVLSIKVGINDAWYGLPGDNRGVPVEQYRAIYCDLIERTRTMLPSCHLVLCEPTVIGPPAHPNGNPYVSPYVEVVREVGQQFSVDGIVPLHSAFITAQRERPQIAWTTDGVHPTSAGHMLIARVWLEVTRNL
jgi:lysophospholipase L1-like esterase